MLTDPTLISERLRFARVMGHQVEDNDFSEFEIEIETVYMSLKTHGNYQDHPDSIRLRSSSPTGKRYAY